MYVILCVCAGCPDCLRVCNVQLKEKLRTLFPTSQLKILDEVLPVEDGNITRFHVFEGTYNTVHNLECRPFLHCTVTFCKLHKFLERNTIMCMQQVHAFQHHL